MEDANTVQHVVIEKTFFSGTDKKLHPPLFSVQCINIVVLQCCSVVVFEASGSRRPLPSAVQQKILKYVC